MDVPSGLLLAQLWDDALFRGACCTELLGAPVKKINLRKPQYSKALSIKFKYWDRPLSPHVFG
jgi:hypothetical protein